MNDLFDRLAAKAAGDGLGKVLPMPPVAPNGGNDMVEDVQTVAGPERPAGVKGPPPTVRGKMPKPVAVLMPATPAKNAALPSPAMGPVPVAAAPLPVLQPVGVPRRDEAGGGVMRDVPQVAAPAPGPVALMVPQRPPRAEPATPIAPPPPRMSDTPVPNVRAMDPPYPSAPRLAGAATPGAAAAAPVALSAPAQPVPDIRISIGQIRVVAPPAPQQMPPPPRQPSAPKGQALKAYLGWRR